MSTRRSAWSCFAKDEYEKGETLFNAAMNGARLRFRPIIMTAFAFILGCVPLWIATGAGGVSRQILGTVVIGGMLAATLIAVFLVPVTFSLAERVANRFSKGDHSASLEVHGHKRVEAMQSHGDHGDTPNQPSQKGQA
jgi:HAE1 family hydrophobic/amphiphilic exporter-1